MRVLSMWISRSLLCLALITALRTDPRAAEFVFTQRPGFLVAVHPDYALTSLLPAGLPNKIIGMDWLPNGDMALLAMQDSILVQQGGGQGWVHVLSGAREAPARPVSVRTLYRGFAHPMGLAVSGDAIHISQRESLVRLIDSDRDGRTDSLATLVTYPDAEISGGWGRWAMNLRYHRGVFYTGLGAYHFIEGPGPCLPWEKRGTVHAVDSSGQVSFIGHGLREPNGIGFGPDGELFATDNDGEWVAANRLVHVRPESFFGLVPCHTWDNSLNATETAVWFPKHLRSPGQPLRLTAGPYQGQMLVGDYVVRNLSRIFLEKVNGQYQGALFPFTGGLASGGLRLLTDEQGALYVGELTIESYESWYVSSEIRPAPGALEKATPRAAVLSNPKSGAFEMLAIRALGDGLEIEFTRPASQEASQPGAYRIRQWRLESTSNYGSPLLDTETLAISEASLSSDGLKAVLKLPGMKPGRIVHVQLHDGFKAADGASPWTFEAWYTLNAIPGRSSLFDSRHKMSDSDAREIADRPRQASFLRAGQGSWVLKLVSQGAIRVRLLSALGRQVFIATTSGPAEWTLPSVPPGLYYLHLRDAGKSSVQGVFLQ